MKMLPKNFYKDLPHIVAPRLIGKLLVRNDGRIGRIAEVEAYDQFDEASHAFCGRTKRNEAMFYQGGHLYVYFSYGLHYCANIVTGPENYGSGVLLRAVEPLEGIPLMLEARNKTNLKNLTNGPGKLTQAFGITKDMYGLNLNNNDKLWIMSDNFKAKVKSTPRIGISKNKDKLWRYILDT